MTETVWSLVIEYTGLSDRELHRSLHESVESARNKSDKVLTYDVPELSEWYRRPTGGIDDADRVGYVLDRNEIGSWPIRIEAERTEVRDD